MPKEYLSTKRIHSQELKRKQIWNALLTLLQEKPLEDIAVKDICEIATVHRTTFYNHFYDVYDLVEYGVSLLLTQLFPEDDVYEFDADGIAENIIRFITTYRKVFSNIIRTPCLANLQLSTQSAFEKYMRLLVDANLDQYSVSLSADVMTKFYCGGLTTLLFWWFQNEQIGIEDIQFQIKEIILMAKKTLLGE